MICNPALASLGVTILFCLLSTVIQGFSFTGSLSTLLSGFIFMILVNGTCPVSPTAAWGIVALSGLYALFTSFTGAVSSDKKEEK